MKQKDRYSKIRNSSQQRSVAVLGYFLVLLFSYQLFFNQALPAVEHQLEIRACGIPAAAIDPEIVTEKQDEDPPVRPSNATVLSAASNGIEKDPSPDDDVNEFDSDVPSQFNTILHAQESLFTPSRHSFASPSSVSLIVLYHCWKSFLH